MEDSNGTLKIGEMHPAAIFAVEYVRKNMTPYMIEALASCSIENNRPAEIALETWRRFENKEPVSDRYIMGLAWSIYAILNGDRNGKF